MLIALGGFLGSGRRFLAWATAKKLGYYYYDIDQKKLRQHFFDREHRAVERTQQPMNDTMRKLLYKSVLDEFPLLSKMYPDIVIDDAFHRSVSREYFLETAEKYFDRVAFVWIDSDESTVRGRLDQMLKQGMIRSIEDALRRRERAKKRFQPIIPQPLSFTHEGSDTEAAERFVSLLRSRGKI